LDLDSLSSTGNRQYTATIKTISAAIIYGYFYFLVLGILKRSFSASGRERHSQARYVVLRSSGLRSVFIVGGTEPLGTKLPHD
jgi:hypothetical protein